MTKGFIFCEFQRKRESLKSWVRHFSGLGMEIHLMRATEDRRYCLWREGKQVPTGWCCTVDELLDSGAYEEVPYEDFLPPAPWQFEITTA